MAYGNGPGMDTFLGFLSMMIPSGLDGCTPIESHVFTPDFVGIHEEFSIHKRKLIDSFI